MFLSTLATCGYHPTVSIARQIDDVIRRALVPSLRADGFRKSARTFHRSLDGVIEVLHVQASTSNAGDVGRFTLNLGVYFPGVDEILGDATLEHPKEYQCHVRERIGAVMGRGDHWWTLDPTTPPADVAPEIERAYRDFVPSWFDRHRSPLSACETLRRSYGATETALALAILGRDASPPGQRGSASLLSNTHATSTSWDSAVAAEPLCDGCRRMWRWIGIPPPLG